MAHLLPGNVFCIRQGSCTQEISTIWLSKQDVKMRSLTDTPSWMGEILKGFAKGNYRENESSPGIKPLIGYPIPMGHP